MADLRQSPDWANYLKSINWKIEKINNIYIYIKYFPVLGSFVKLQRSEILNQKIITFIENKYHPFQFSIEPGVYPRHPERVLRVEGFHPSNSPSLPTKTLIINLNKSENELLKSFSQKVRYNITRTSFLKRVEIVESDNVLDFTNFWRENFEKNRFPFFSQQKNIIAMQKSFGENSKILLAKKDNKIIAVLFLLFFDKVSYYMYAAANNEGRKNFAPTLLTWHAILLSKKLGMKTFDFDGIYDTRFPLESWQGFTKFKSGFSKTEVSYPGLFVKSKFNIKIF
ncbi:MAG TPA: peptidoglycan bridge formation glycyltransferase FemA/FemB family protein [Patescibacteria group bacterium]|nr:peptidoglycan bridge formation glycyltransferase FemA/FemB family protein [Patescibacteria group bacterium]